MPQETAAGNWCLIESDPGVFTELVKGFGVTGVQVEELFSLDDEFFAELKPIYGLIFLFKWRDSDEPSGELAPNAPEVFFTQQVISNACASQAIINLLLNTHSEAVQLGTVLGDFRDFTAGFDPMTRGLALSNSEPIRQVHNSFAREHYMEVESARAGKEDNYHFITYLPVGSTIYELDGLREAPIRVGEVKEGQDWIHVVKPAIQQRIEKYTAGEIHFNLMAVLGDRKTMCEKRLAELLGTGMESDVAGDEVLHLQDIIAQEEEKQRRYKVENNRRRHNYTPFIVELLKILAREGKLVPLVEKGIADARTKAAVDGRSDKRKKSEAASEKKQ